MAQISSIYAEALFELAFEEGKTKEFANGLQFVCDALKEEGDYVHFIDAPSIPLSERRAALEEAFGNFVPEAVISMLCILCEKGLFSELWDITSEYKELVRFLEGVVLCKVTSAVELTENQRLEFTAALEKQTGRKTETVFETDPSLIGGMTVEMDGKVYDGSLRKKLIDMKEVIKK